MMKIEQANKILAEACGYTPLNGLSIRINNDELIEWTIEDARCREMVRERFGIGTTCHEDFKTFIAYTRECTFAGKTIAEAEIACMLKIAESLNEHTTSE